jgi:hypothetical protein
MPNFFISNTFLPLLTTLPQLIASIVGLIFCLMCLRKHGKPALFAAIGLALFCFFDMLGPLVSQFMINFYSGSGIHNLQWLLYGWAFFRAVIHAIGIGFLLTAVFTGRRRGASFNSKPLD